MMEFSSHLKADHLKTLVQRDLPCETILNDIQKLLGVPQTEFESLAEKSATEDPGTEQATSVEQNAQLQAAEEEKRDEELDRREQSYADVLSEFSGLELRLAKGLLQRLENAKNASWDYETGNLIVRGHRYLHSSITLLLKKCTQLASPTLPVALIPFLMTLIDIKVPLAFIKDNDCLNIREGLLKIKKRKIVESQPAVIVEEDANVAPVVEQPLNVQSEAVNEIEPVDDLSHEEELAPDSSNTAASKKRGRELEEDEEEENESAKKRRVEVEEGEEGKEQIYSGKKRKREFEGDEEEIDYNKPKKSVRFAADSEAGETSAVGPSVPLRRSQRLKLKPHLQKDWSPIV